jgi:NAD(P)H dehydrogenase (quinone)
MLLSKDYPVRAFVRREDERANSLRRKGAEVFVGDLLNAADVATALKGCQRIYFSMSLSPYYVDANILMAAAARAQGDTEIFLNISEFEQSYMTLERMTAPREDRLAWLGGLVADWSPQQRAHWISEQALNWSGLPVVHIRATMFVENPILSWFPLKQLIAAGELHLPFGAQRIAPLAGYDVAEFCAKILIDPKGHAGRQYELTGPELKDMYGFANDYAAVLDRPVTYVPQDLDAWITRYIEQILGTRDPHVADHLKTITRLVAGGRYDVVTDQLEPVLGRPPKTVRWSLERYPRVRQALGAA